MFPGTNLCGEECFTILQVPEKVAKFLQQYELLVYVKGGQMGDNLKRQHCGTSVVKLSSKADSFTTSVVNFRQPAQVRKSGEIPPAVRAARVRQRRSPQGFGPTGDNLKSRQFSTSAVNLPSKVDDASSQTVNFWAGPRKSGEVPAAVRVARVRQRRPPQTPIAHNRGGPKP